MSSSYANAFFLVSMTHIVNPSDQIPRGLPFNGSKLKVRSSFTDPSMVLNAVTLPLVRPALSNWLATQTVVPSDHTPHGESSDRRSRSGKL